MSLLVGLCYSGRPTSVEWGLGLALQTYPTNLKVQFCSVRGKKIDEARNEVSRQAIDLGFEFLLFLDDDVILPPDAVRRLTHTLKASGADVAGGIYPTKWLPAEPVVYRGDGRGAFYDWKDGDVFEADAIGTGCMIIRVSILKELEEPWFKWDYGVEGGREVSDDIYFCRKLREKGFKILGDSNVICKHYDFITGKTFELSKGL